jgi:hypothetical protein
MSFERRFGEFRGSDMRKLIAFAFLALVLAGGVAFVVEQSTPAAACGGSGC